MASSYNAGRPLPLVVSVKERTETGPRFELDAEVLKQMMDLDKLSSAKVAVISVTGAFRTGKSFLLNFFLRYLRALSRGDTRDWILSEDQLDDGFHWRSGIERHHRDPHLPFFIRKPDGQEVAVLLMDTQGTFDHQSTQQDCTTIFAFSTLMSSVQILNISQKVQETDLQHLRLFVEFAGMAKGSKEKALQHLWFLIRDWQNPDDFEYGVADGAEYLKQILKCDEQMPRENQELRQGITHHFEQASCCLLPHPGNAVASSKFRGELKKLDAMFVDELEKFVALIASPENIPVKQINGRDFKGVDFFALKEYFDAICSSRLPTPRSIFTATVDMINVLAASEAKQLFETKIQEFFRSESSLDISSAEMDKVLAGIEKEALKLFNSRCMEVADFDVDCLAEDTEDDCMRFEFNADIFKQMRNAQKLATCKVVLISVAGAFRKGKSFLLNFFLRYLRALSRGDTRDWIRSDDQLDDGFHWRAGSERDTTGILIWSEPFFIRKPDGQEVAVLLMDTQGAFDHQSTQRDCATIFGFSTLLSSVQIFNISQNIQETDLQHLRLFVEFASMARESKDKKVLQHLWFLTRDWQNSHEHDYGSTGGQEYLDKVLACDSRKPKENQELRLGIKRYFERASCCLLPHPGKAVAAKDFRGEIHRLDPEFVDEMEKFIPVIASPQALVVKKVNGTELPGKELFKFFDIYFEAFKNGKMPTPRNIFDATVEMANITAAQGARQMFEDSLDPDLHDDEFFDILEVLKQQSLEYFLSNCMQPESAATKKTLEKLQEEIQGLLDNKKFVRRLQSRTLSADRKNQQLQHEIGRLQLQNMDPVVEGQQWDDEQDRFQFNRDFAELIDSPERLAKSPVAVISVAGAFRKGKSFLLNFFLRYLRALSRGDTRDWILSEDQLDDGFHWRAGSERDTTGILIWSEPFFIRKPDGQEVAVLLMDTQGTFDHQSTQQDCTTIFAFSTLMSSVQIFNISQNIQETDLQHLRLFIEFASMAKNSAKKVLQHLWFLIRDWQNPDEYDYGANGGEDYLKNVLACDEKKPPENQALRQGIKRQFEAASSFLLPYPGKAVTRADFKGQVDRLDSDFVEHLDCFVRRILAPENLVVKKLNGKVLTGREFFSLIEVYFDAFRLGKLPTPKSIFTATVEMANQSASRDAVKFFEDSMGSLSGPTAISDQELSDLLSTMFEQAMQHFDDNCMERGSKDTAQTRMKLEAELRGLFQQQQMLNQLKSDKIEAETKSRMLMDHIKRMQDESLAAAQRMCEMEKEFADKVAEIQRSAITREQMEEMLVKHSTAQKELEKQNEKMMKRTVEMAEKNRKLMSKLKQNKEEAMQQQQEMMEEFMRQMKVAQEKYRKAAEDSSNFFTKYVSPILSAAVPTALRLWFQS
uniref:GB1/RHD3-type G domain-containing protein n=1 Tax=Macrostomum lignano TaxID=282301 RepID=A0A1I8H0U9_9PLAT